MTNTDTLIMADTDEIKPPAPTVEEQLVALTARVDALTDRPNMLANAERWLLQDARKLALARRGFDEDTKGRMIRLDPNDARTLVDHYERVVSRAVDMLVDAASADGFGLRL